MSYLLERIEDLHGLVQEAETLNEAIPWARGEGSKWAEHAHGKQVKKGSKWVKGAYLPYAGKEYSKGVQGVWKRLPNGAPIFIVKKRPEIPKSARRTKKAAKMFKGKIASGGRLKKSGKRASAAKGGWGTRKANIAKKEASKAKGKATRSRRTLARRLGAGFVEDMD